MKVTLNNVGSLIDATTAQTTINNNNQTIEDAFENTLSLDGTQPNAMLSTLDMDSYQIVNLPAPATANSPLRLQDLNTFIGGGTIASIPVGGSTGDALVKNSNIDYDVKWTSDSNTVAAGPNISITGSSPATIATVQNPNFTTSVTTPSLILAGNTLTTKTGTGSIVLNTSPTILGHPVVEGVTSTGATGTGKFVFDTSPVLVTPNLGTPSAGVLTNATGTASGLTAGNVTTNANLTGAVTSVGNASSLGSFTSLSLKTALTDETGSGAAVFATSPTFVTPLLGTPTSGVLTSCTGTASGLTAGTVTTNANLTGDVTSVGNATTFTGKTGGALGQIPGTITNDTASAGNIGQYVESVVGAGSAVSLTSGTQTNITSISLTAGDWDVLGDIYFIPATTTSTTRWVGSLSTVSGTIQVQPGQFFDNTLAAFVTGGNGIFGTIPGYRISLSGTTTIFLVALPAFTVSTMTGYGILRARRMR